jgi:branched-chain amino acid transport system substrate-binding protein
VHAPEARASALAGRALKLGVKRFAIIGPDSTVGRRLREAFRKAVVAGGGQVVAEASYVAGATSFSAAVAGLKKGAPEAVFVPDTAERLELLAPALAVADLWPQPWNKARPAAAGARGAAAAGGGGGGGGDRANIRPVLLLSTASELGPRLVQAAGRYVQGALLCPGFYGAESDPRSRAFVEAYRAAYNQYPHAAEAYAYDAVSLFRAVTERGARTRSDVVKALSAAGGGVVLQGLTGDLAFGPDHARVDPPLVYMVEGDEIRPMR